LELLSVISVMTMGHTLLAGYSTLLTRIF